MKTKPSRRRDSLAQKRPGRLGDIEKAARKWAYAYFSNFELGMDFYSPSLLQETLVRFAQRHGAKVRRETLKECAGIAHDEAIQNKAAAFRALTAGRQLVSQFRDSDGEACAAVERKILALTPRGPEKGRRAK